MGQLTIDRTERGMNKPGVTLLVRHLVQLFRRALMIPVRTVQLSTQHSYSEGLIEDDDAGEDDIDVIDACPELMTKVGRY